MKGQKAETVGASSKIEALPAKDCVQEHSVIFIHLLNLVGTMRAAS